MLAQIMSKILFYEEYIVEGNTEGASGGGLGPFFTNYIFFCGTLSKHMEIMFINSIALAFLTLANFEDVLDIHFFD